MNHCPKCLGTGTCSYCSGSGRVGDFEFEVTGANVEDVERVATTLLEKGVERRNEGNKTELHPWNVAISLLFDEESDVVIKVIDRTGLQINWSLTPEHSGTHKQRKREYRPRIESSYDKLSDEDKLRVTFIVATEFARIDQIRADKMRDGLKAIGWKIESDRLTTDNRDIVEMFFPQGTFHDAYVEIKQILLQANKAVTVIDPYIDSSILKMLSTVPSGKLQVKFLSYNLPKDFTLEAKKFLLQHADFAIEIRTTKEFHDRFVILDEIHCYHIGASIKDAGSKAFMISRIEDPTNIDGLIKQADQTWNLATPITL